MEAGIYRCPARLFLAIAFDEIATTVQISSPMHDQLHRPGGPALFVNGRRDSTCASGPVASWSKASPDPNCSPQTLATQRLDSLETCMLLITGTELANILRP